MKNRFEYFGSVAGSIELNDDNGTIRSLFDSEGYSKIVGSPYPQLRVFYMALGNATRFGHDHFLNNIQLSEWMGVHSPDKLVNINPDQDSFWHDPVQDIWITTADNIVYHIFK